MNFFQQHHLRVCQIFYLKFKGFVLFEKKIACNFTALNKSCQYTKPTQHNGHY
jgi:hypothetical protein